MTFKLLLKYLTFFIGLILFAMSAIMTFVTLVKLSLSTTFMVSTALAIWLSVSFVIGYMIQLVGLFLVASHTES